jgi:parvulin-like peptidyl-prolyl isomerase
VRVEEEDLRKGFEAYFGEKVECLLILWPRTPRDREIAIKQYELIRKSKDEFDRAARTQASARLAANGGKIEAFGRFSTGNEAVEREVFKLRPGEITPLIETPEGYAVFKLERRLPADTNVKLEDKRASLEKEIIEKKIILQIPTEFQKLREVAAPNVLMRPAVREEELTRQVKKELEETKVFSKENKIPSR